MQDTLAPQQVIYWFLLQSGFKRQHQEAFEKAGEPTREAWKAMGSQVAIIVVVVININSSSSQRAAVAVSIIIPLLLITTIIAITIILITSSSQRVELLSPPQLHPAELPELDFLFFFPPPSPSSPPPSPPLNPLPPLVHVNICIVGLIREILREGS